jgi:hypothetical protein
MRNPFKRGDVYDAEPNCRSTAIGGTLIALGVLGGLGYLVFYGATELLARL